MSKARDWLVATSVLALGRLRPRPRIERERIVEPGEPDRRAESLVILLFLATAACAVAFIVVYAIDSLPDQTQLLGASIGLAFAFLAAACIVLAKHVIVTEEIEEDYPDPENPSQQEAIEQIVEETGDPITRKRLLLLAGGAAGGTLGLALVTPAVSLGPVFDLNSFYGTPWHRGRRLVDDNGKPYHASDIEENDFYTAYPENANKEEFGSPLIVIRLPVSQLELPPERAHWAPQGILAYSKICTHAGCAISIYRAPLFQPDEPKPAFVCPCHYSTFDPATGGKVLFGPAGRELPQLPLEIDAAGELRSASNFDQPVGPSWWGVREGKPNP